MIIENIRKKKDFAFVKFPEQHTMENNLYQYVNIKIHHLLNNANNFDEIIVRGLYDRHNSEISTKEKNDKLFNWKRPTASIKNHTLYINCFPGNDYIKHYSALIKTHLYLNNLNNLAEKVSFYKTSRGKIINTLKKTNLPKIPKSDFTIIGKIDKIKPYFTQKNWEDSNEDFNWCITEVYGKKVCFIGCKFSFWGDIIGYIAKILANSNHKNLIYIGKLGGLKNSHIPNTHLASGCMSFVDNKIIKWKNMFNFLDKSYNINYGFHYTLYSIIAETKEWLNFNKHYDFVDPEIGRIAQACNRSHINFSYLHIISDSLYKLYDENLSNERLDKIIKKRDWLLNQIADILKITIKNTTK